ncbi:MAG: tRNA pseudouridine(38-40) synthase TruA [Actinobacteria bacterium]|nr:tRNA pseudouridine(38-40) synthase TruA [Actinomycetota bacterium]
MEVMVLTVSYNGSAYSGFARQPKRTTVQGEIEHALGILFRREVLTTCAGRTDAGVHALGQHVSFEVMTEEVEGRSIRKMTRSLNALTPEDIVIRDIRFMPEGFSARFDAKSREYRYRIVYSAVPPMFLREYAWWIREESLDITAMRKAAQHLIGEHDFKSFCLASSAVDKPTCRNVMEVELFEEGQLGEDCLVIRVVGNAFLHSMVRTIVGTLVEIGTGRREPAWVLDVMEAHDRNAAGPCAPACGLTFWSVSY